VALKEQQQVLDSLEKGRERVLDEVRRITKKIENMEAEKQEWAEEIKTKTALLKDFDLKVQAARKEITDTLKEHPWIE